MGVYEGTDNLEVMQLAENYNAFLSKLVIGAATNANRILDFGAGIGTFALQMTNAGYEVECVEPDAAQLERIKEHGIVAYSSIEQVPPASVSYIYSLNVLEHIEDDGRVVKELAEKLEDGGRIMIYLPAFNVLYSSMDEKVGHFRRYDRSMLRVLLENAGLTIECLEYVDSAGFFASLIFKLFGNKSGDLNPVGLKIFDRYVFPVSRVFDRFLGKVLGKNVYAVAVK